ncbi:Ran-specific GTPase-activating protein 2 [Spathaspora sp. JA1]|nr:Ran-specific GTPase-activating protein 2 [Spathaspora sp. JA1]
MSEESSKRKIESEEALLDAKRTKSTHEEQFKQSIIEEVTSKLQLRIDELEARIGKLEKEFLTDEDETGVTLDDEEGVTSEEPEDETKTPTDPPVQDIKRESSVPLPEPAKKATFGASSFKFPPVKLGSTSPPVSNKPVFGATTIFSKNLSGDDRPNVADTLLPSRLKASKLDSTGQDDIKLSPPPAKIQFGSNSKFGNAFQQSLTKKSFLDSESDKENNKDAAESTASAAAAVPTSGAAATSPPPQFKQVDLAPIHQSTGEEDEISHFNSMAKIFELDLTTIDEGWKERGVGPLHLNQSRQDQTQIRLVMRSQGLLRVVLNYKINKDTTILQGLEASLSPGKYLRLNSVNTEGKPIQYLLKFSSELLRDELIEKIESLKSQM